MGIIRNLKREYQKQLFRHRINKDIGKYKYVHIMYNDKFNKPFVDFLNKYFDSNEHMVLCYRSSTDYVARPFPEGKNVYEFIKFDGLNLGAANIEKIIFHSLFTKGCVDYLYDNKELLKKSYWAIWGGDLYNAKRYEKHDFVRKNFKGYLTDFDKDVAIEKYSLKNKPFYCIHAIFPITKNMITDVQSIPKSDSCTKIQINNSCDVSTLEMLDVLSKFRDENIRITTILSYGKMQYKDEIIKRGKEIFDEKFEYVENLMSPNDYAKHLAQNDILILNQNRQQGVGNTVASLAMGKKVFIRSEISTFKKLQEFNLNVFDTNKISQMNFEELKQNSNIEITQKDAMKFFDEEYKASLWKAVFNAE